jgi:hypothetical protein
MFALTKTFSRRALGLIAAGLMIAGIGCGSSVKKTELTVPLTWKSTEMLNTGAFAGTLPESTIYVAVNDKRPKKDAIGENAEDDTPKPIYAGGEPTAFVQEAFVSQFEKAGLKVAADKASADRTIGVDLLQFWTQETGTYKGDVQSSVTVMDKAGKTLWKGNVSGSTGKFGRSLSAENYQEVYSDCTLKMIQGLLDNATFRKSLDKAATPMATPAMPMTPATPATPHNPPATPSSGGTPSGNPLARPATPTTPAPPPYEPK